MCLCLAKHETTNQTSAPVSLRSSAPRVLEPGRVTPSIKLQQRRVGWWLDGGPRVRCCRELCCIPPAVCICKPGLDEGGVWLIILTRCLSGAHQQENRCCWGHRWILDTINMKTNLCSLVFWLKKVLAGIFTHTLVFPNSAQLDFSWNRLPRETNVPASNHLQVDLQVKLDMFAAAEAKA